MKKCAILSCLLMIFLVIAVHPQRRQRLRSSPAAGILDPTFNGTGKVQTNLGSLNDWGEAIATQMDGKIVCVGYSNDSLAHSAFAVARFNGDGSLDGSFGNGGKVLMRIGTGDDWAKGLVIQTDGKIVVGGTTSAAAGDDFVLVRFNTDGSLDNSFGAGGIVVTNVLFVDRLTAIALQYDGKIVAAGSTDDGASAMALVRYFPDGTLDPVFGAGGIVIRNISTSTTFLAPRAVAVQNDGKIAVTGSVATGSISEAFATSRFLRRGDDDPTFGDRGRVLTQIGSPFSSSAGNSIIVQKDGKLVAGGLGNGGDFVCDYALIRYLANGTLDPEFGAGGTVTTAVGAPSLDVGRAIKVQPDGKIVFAGSYYESNVLFHDFAVLRYMPDGSPDTSGFGQNGFVKVDWGGSDASGAIDLQPDGKILAAGQSFAGSSSTFSLMRLSGDSPAPAQAFVSGRVLDSKGNGVSRAILTLTNLQTGAAITALSSPFGYYQFNGIQTNRAYRVSVTYRRYVAPDQSFRLLDDISGLLFTQE
jgi:uncharacterized delta-60 repeat protein